MYRKGTREDCEAVYALICDMESRQLPLDRFRGIYEAQLADPRYFCLVCELENRVAGVLNLRFEEQLHHAGRIAEIMEFAVDACCRNQRIGAGMLEHACRLAGEMECIQIEVACNQLREDTHRFYLREGMQNFHYKFSRSLTDEDMSENVLGR